MGRKNLLNYWASSSEPRVTKCSNRIKWGKKCGKNSHILFVFNSKSSGSELTACPLLRLKEKSWKQPVTPPGRFDNSVFLSPDAKWVPLFVVKKVEGSFTFNCQELFRFSGIQNSHLYFLPTEKGLELGWLRDTIEDGIFIATRHTHTHTHTHTLAFILQFAKGQSQTFTQGKDSFWEMMSTPLTEATHLPGLRAVNWAGKTWNGSLPQLQLEPTLLLFKFYWKIVVLQCCVPFRYAAELFSYTYILFHYRLLQDTKYSFLGSIVGSCQLSNTLYIVLFF